VVFIVFAAVNKRIHSFIQPVLRFWFF